MAVAFPLPAAQARLPLPRLPGGVTELRADELCEEAKGDDDDDEDDEETADEVEELGEMLQGGWGGVGPADVANLPLDDTCCC